MLPTILIKWKFSMISIYAIHWDDNRTKWEKAGEEYVQSEPNNLTIPYQNT